TAVRVTVPVTDGWPDAIACTQSAQTDFSGTVKQTGTPGAQVIIRNGTTPRQRLSDNLCGHSKIRILDVARRKMNTKSLSEHVIHYEV
ncbi:hypothetical protein SK427_25190, partial [Escherichia coli]|uniref:hypothetical protein n=1 Tax=Escherichia coli TaxID=562 RepID=UPI0029F4F340